ncbi:MAG: prepilin-type N-terminal cleavage/methylation domain-containing protein [Proteobacteria bacterium]|nr:prepilin-type N-terminal cleavage/methylation domain-containing protein [Pseudomonadota bacterium]
MSDKTGTSDNIKGFTLIEVLIAIVIFAMVVTVVFTSFREIAFSAGVINKTGHVYEMANGAMCIMTRDLESVFVEQKPGYQKPGFDADPDPCRFEGGTELTGNTVFPKIRFTTLSHLPVNRDNRGGIAEVVYYMDESEEYGFVLRRSDRIFFSEEFVKKKSHPVLLRKIKTFTVKYYDAEGGEHDDWDSESDEYRYATPSAVGIWLEIEDDDRVLPFEIRIQLKCVREKTE